MFQGRQGGQERDGCPGKQWRLGDRGVRRDREDKGWGVSGETGGSWETIGSVEAGGSGGQEI